MDGSDTLSLSTSVNVYSSPPITALSSALILKPPAWSAVYGKEYSKESLAPITPPSPICDTSAVWNGSACPSIV